MSTRAPVRYCLVLDLLLDDQASFTGGETLNLSIPRDHWVDLGRPGAIEITPAVTP